MHDAYHATRPPHLSQRDGVRRPPAIHNEHPNVRPELEDHREHVNTQLRDLLVQTWERERERERDRGKR